MVSATEVPAEIMIKEIEEQLRKTPEIQMPEWANFVKTGSHNARKATNPDWWHTRCASILRKAYIEGVVGVGRLRTWYGGRKVRGIKPEIHADAGGKIIRVALQQLEKAGFIKKLAVGRTVSPKGRSLLDKITLKFKGEIADRRTGEVETGKIEPVKEENAGGAGEGAVKAGDGEPKKSVNKKHSKPVSVGKVDKDKPGKPEPGAEG